MRLPNYLFSLFVVLLIFTSLANAQWAVVSSTNTGSSGKIYAAQNNLFLYGTWNKFHFYRSTDGGNTWADSASSFPYDVYALFNYNGEIFAVTTTLASGIYRFYVSGDGGTSWTEKSNIPSITGNGAILGMTSDGNNLFAVSNRKSYYTSQDNGLSWKETLMNTNATGSLTAFAAVGNLHVGVFLATGALVSPDAGQTWTVKNPSVALTNVVSSKGNIYGISNGAGVYKFDTGTQSWISVSTGLPGAASFQFAKQLLVYGDALFYYAVGFLDSKPAIYSSVDGGNTWTQISNDGLSTVSGSGSNSVLAATSSNLFFYDFKSSTSVASVYKLANPVSEVEESTVPHEFQLAQNFPNPFNPTTTIRYSVSGNSMVTLAVYNVLGRKVQTLVNEVQQSGRYEVSFDATKLSSGVYFYTLKAGNLVQTKRMLLLK